MESITTTRVLCLDGYLNATVFVRGTEVCALGRARENGPLKLCRVFPQPGHLATVPQPPGHMLEDPRHLGFYSGRHYFICADAIEYFESPGDYAIYQTVVALTPANEMCDIWRVEAPGTRRVEKNWVPLGTLDENGCCALLYSHDTRQRLTLNCARRRAVLEEAPPPLTEPARKQGVRGGTPLLPLPKGAGWWGLGHRAVPSSRRPIAHASVCAVDAVIT